LGIAVPAGPMADGIASATVRLGATGACVRLSDAECWQLYASLADHAPFVRQQLRTARNSDGGGTVTLVTAEERVHVLDAIVGGRGAAAATDGLARLAETLRAAAATE
jgi:hypothetical protein